MATAPKGLTWTALAAAAFPVVGAAAVYVGGLWLSDIMERFDEVERGIQTLTNTVTQQGIDLGNRITGLQSDVRLQGRDISDIDLMLGDHEARIRSLEAWQRNVLTRVAPEPI